MAKKIVIELGGQRFNIAWLQSVTEDRAVEALKGSVEDPNRTRNAWKQANGVSVRNYTKTDEAEKPKRKRVSKKKED